MSAKSTIKQSQTSIEGSSVVCCSLFFFFFFNLEGKKTPMGFHVAVWHSAGGYYNPKFFSRPPNSKLKLSVMRATWSSEYFKA